MKRIFAILFVIVIQSCGPARPVYLKGKYVSGLSTQTVNGDFESTWTKIIDIITENGLSIKILDKASGLVLSDVTNFRWPQFTFENNGKLLNDKAYIVTEHMAPEFEQQRILYRVTASYNIRVKNGDPGKSSVSIIMHNISAITGDNNSLRGKSTGNFEKWFLDEVVSRSEK